MNRILSFATVAAVAVAIAMGMGSMPVAADENATIGNESDPQLVEGQPVDEDITLTDWSYSGGTFSLTFENERDRPKSVTISEATQGGEGAQQFAIRQERLLPGSNTVTMSVNQRGGAAAVTVTTSDSISDGHGLEISTGQQRGEDPFAPFGGTSGVFSGVGLSVLMSGGAALWVLWREESGVMRA